MMKNPIFGLKNGGSTLLEFDLYTTKYGIIIIIINVILVISFRHWSGRGIN